MIFDESLGLSFTIAAEFSPAQSSQGPSPAGLMTIFYSLIFETPPTWRARSPYLHPQKKRVASLYPQALGSLFVASYDSQSYGGGVRPRLHTEDSSTCSQRKGYTNKCTNSPLIPHEPHRKQRVHQFFYYCMFIHCLSNTFTEPLPSNYRDMHRHTDWYEGFMKYAVEMDSGAMIHQVS
jgi:hypothetical protein